MFGFFKKDPLKKLQKEYEAKLEEAMHMQRNGKIREYSFLSSEAEDIRLKIEATKHSLEKWDARVFALDARLSKVVKIFEDRIAI